MDLRRRVSLPKVNERLRCPLPIDRVRHGGFDLGHEKNGAGIPGRNGCRVSNIFQPPERSTPVGEPRAPDQPCGRDHQRLPGPRYVIFRQ
jgi:hypothetical protein